MTSTTIVTSPSQNWDLVPVRGHYMGTDGLPIIGTVTFTPMATRFVDGQAQTTIIGRPITADINPRDGKLYTELPATDDMDIDGRGFTWEVQENFPGGGRYSISVPIANISDGIDLATAIQVPSDPGTAANDYVQLVEDSLAEANAAAVAAEGHADDAESAAASVQREQVNGVAGLDSNGLIYTSRLPSTPTHSPAEKGIVLYADSFQRKDGPLAGTMAPTGGLYTADDATEKIAGAFYTPNCISGQARITYNPAEAVVTSLVMHVKFSPASTGLDNFVIGCCDSGFGKGSLQLGTSATELYLFLVIKDPANPGSYIHGTHPITGAYTEYLTLAAIQYAKPLLRDDKTIYPCEAHIDTVAKTVTIVAYDGTRSTSPVDSRILDVIGRKVGIQGRSSVSTGYIGGMKYAAGHGVLSTGSQPVAGALLRIIEAGSFAETTAPAAGWEAGDFHMVFYGAAANWITGSSQTYASQWGLNDHTFEWSVGLDGRPLLRYSFNGDTYTSAVCNLPIPFANGALGWHAVSRNSATGVVKFLWSNDGVTWTQIGVDRPGTGGALWVSAAGIHVGERGTGPFFGDVGYYALRTGTTIGSGTIVAGVDFRGLFSGTGLAGQSWLVHDPHWVVPAPTLPTIPTPDNGATPVGKGELVFRITDPPFNAVPDGVTNCSPAITSASAAAAAAGPAGYGIVEFPYSTQGYLCTTPITLGNGVTYRGDRHVRIKRGGANTASLFNASTLTDVTFEGLTLDSAGILTSGSIYAGTRTKIRDVWFADSGFQYAAHYGVNFASGTTLVTDVLVEKCRFTGMRSNIQIRGNTQRVTLADNDFSDWSNTAIAVDGDATTSSKDLIIRGNRIHDHRAISRPVTSKKIVSNVATIDITGGNPWSVGETIYVDLIDPLFDGNHTLTAVTASSLSWAKTAANTGPTASTGYASSGNRQPISVQSDVLVAPWHERVTITGNQILGNYVNHQATDSGGTADMISVHHTNHFVISNNIVEGSGDCGFTISVNSTRGTVTGNTIIGAGNCGIAVGSIATGIWIKGLTISGNTIMNCGQNGGGIWASTAINLRKLTGGIVVGNFLGDDQAVPTQWYGISLGDTSGGSCTDVHIGPNQYTGVTTAKRWSPSGNVRLTFSDLPTIITKPSDTVQALNSNALVPDPHLQATFETAATYEVEVVLAYTCNGVAGATPGIGVGIYGPTGTTATFYADASGSTATGATTTTSSSNRTFITSINSAINSGGATGASAIRMILKIKVNTGTTSGVFGIRTGQQTADPTNATTVVTGSSMTYRRIG